MEYGEKVKTSDDTWKWIDETLDTAVSIFNRYTPERNLEMELLYDEETSANGSRLYELEGEDWDKTLEVHIKKDDDYGTGLGIDTPGHRDRTYNRFMEAVKKAMYCPVQPENDFISEVE